MALNPLNASNLEQLALKGLNFIYQLINFGIFHSISVVTV